MTRYYCPNCRQDVAPSTDRCNGCGCRFALTSASKPETAEEIVNSSGKTNVILVIAAVVIGLLGLFLYIYYQALKGLAGGH